MVKHETIEYQGISLHLTIYETGPQVPSLVFIPGMTAHAGAYTELVPGANYLEALAAEGFNVIGLDLQGHGRSGGPRGLFTYQDLMGNISRYERLRCRKDLVVVPGAGHMLPLEYLETTVPLVAEWFRKTLT